MATYNNTKGFVIDDLILVVTANSVDGNKVISGTEYSYTLDVNEKGNAELSNRNSPQGSKVNLVSAGAIQIKPGITKKGKSAAIALDNEFNSVSPTEIEIQACNGASQYNDAIMGVKLNASELVIDTVNAYPTEFDSKEFHIKYRIDKWNQGLPDGRNNQTQGPIYLKQHARAFDFRCHGWGGIALQIAGQDSESHENKIKFESDRTSNITDDQPTYNGEGGKGLEFGTFNNLHSSLFTKDYRFNEEGIVYAVTRGELVTNESGKIDYPTQDDDFKDILPSDPNLSAKVKDIVKTAHALNGAPGIKTECSGAGNVKITAEDYYDVVPATDSVTPDLDTHFNLVIGQIYYKNDLKLITTSNGTLFDLIGKNIYLTGGDTIYTLRINPAPKIDISSPSEVSIESKLHDVNINSGDCIKMEGPEIRLNAMNPDKSGGLINCGATAQVQFLEHKFTKSGNVEAPDSPVKITLGTLNNSWKVIYFNPTLGKFKRACDILYYDPDHTQVYNPSNHVKGVPIYFADGTLVPADTTCFVMTPAVDNVITIYKMGTKGSEAVTSKSATAVATVNSNGTGYQRLIKEGSTYYYEDTIFMNSYYTPTPEEITINPEEYKPTVTCDIADILKLVNHFKLSNPEYFE